MAWERNIRGWSALVGAGIFSCLGWGLAPAYGASWAPPSVNELPSFIVAPQLISPSVATQGAALTGRLPLTTDSHQELWLRLVPELADASLMPAHSHTGRETSHTSYRIFWQGYWLYSAYFQVHERAGTITVVNGQWPHCDMEKFVPSMVNSDHFPGQAEALRSEKVWMVEDCRLIPALLLEKKNSEGRLVRQLLRWPTAELLLEEPLDFRAGAAEVYSRNALESDTHTAVLEPIAESGYLENEYLMVFGASASAPRAFDQDLLFSYSPTAEADLFDQVQTFFNANRAWHWFTAKGRAPAGQLQIFTNTTDSNNAYYLPPSGTTPGQIHLGRGDFSEMRYLARDTDVVTHELGHHFLYQFLKTSRGESGVLHEGISDYFAYAAQGDPYLGESIVPHAPYLRTASLPGNQLYDDPNQDRTPHHLGQYWAAMLWELRVAAGDAVDALVFQSLPYLQPQSGLQDALLALLNADRDLHPLPPGDPEHGVFGQNKCAILNAALARGFSQPLRHVNGFSCGLDLMATANSRAQALTPEVRQSDAFDQLITGCGVVSGEDRANHTMTIIMLCAPFLVLLRSRRKKGEV